MTEKKMPENKELEQELFEIEKKFLFGFQHHLLYVDSCDLWVFPNGLEENLLKRIQTRHGGTFMVAQDAMDIFYANYTDMVNTANNQIDNSRLN